MFDDIIHLEEHYIKLGKEQGEKDAEASSYVEGIEIGFLRAVELGQEISFYRTITETFLQRINNNAEHYSPRALKLATSVLDTIQEFPMRNSPEVDIILLLENIRGKYRLVCLIMGVGNSLSFKKARELLFSQSNDSGLPVASEISF